MDMDKSSAIARINEILKERGMTLNQLKDGSGISTTIYQWQRNASREATRVPSLTSIEKICNFLGISLSYFFASGEQERKSAKTTKKLIKEEKYNSVFESFNEVRIDGRTIKGIWNEVSFD